MKTFRQTLILLTLVAFIAVIPASASASQANISASDRCLALTSKLVQAENQLQRTSANLFKEMSKSAEAFDRFAAAKSSLHATISKLNIARAELREARREGARADIRAAKKKIIALNRRIALKRLRIVSARKAAYISIIRVKILEKRFHQLNGQVKYLTRLQKNACEYPNRVKGDYQAQRYIVFAWAALKGSEKKTGRFEFTGNSAIKTIASARGKAFVSPVVGSPQGRARVGVTSPAATTTDVTVNLEAVSDNRVCAANVTSHGIGAYTCEDR